jgi:hypothetical protein
MTNVDRATRSRIINGRTFSPVLVGREIYLQEVAAAVGGDSIRDADSDFQVVRGEAYVCRISDLNDLSDEAYERMLLNAERTLVAQLENLRPLSGVDVDIYTNGGGIDRGDSFYTYSFEEGSFVEHESLSEAFSALGYTLVREWVEDEINGFYGYAYYRNDESQFVISTELFSQPQTMEEFEEALQRI